MPRVSLSSYDARRSLYASAVLSLELDRRVFDLKSLVKLSVDLLEQSIVDFGVRFDQVRGEGDLRRTHRPDVEIVHGGDAGKGL